jgi:hypothetical protein
MKALVEAIDAASRHRPAGSAFGSRTHTALVFTTLIAPVVAGVLLIGVLAVAVANFDVLIGDTGILAWLLPSLLVVAAIAGAVAAHLLKKRAPASFASIGRHRE